MLLEDFTLMKTKFTKRKNKKPRTHANIQNEINLRIILFIFHNQITRNYTKELLKFCLDICFLKKIQKIKIDNLVA